ncbi:MAG: clostripain-related cysteine peptidase [Myxococcales bacterium]
MSRSAGFVFKCVLSLCVLTLAGCPGQQVQTGCEGQTCSNHGACSLATGSAACACDTGYQGTVCDQCAPGYHLAGTACVADDTCLPTSCSGHGTCEVVSGKPTCTCATGWTGAHCGACAAGLQDHDGDGTCRPDCASANLSCGAHGRCSDQAGTAACACDTGWAGAACDTCASGYSSDGSGGCAVDRTCKPATCAGHGTCNDSSGAPVCTCEVGYSGAHCEACAAGYQDRDGDGVCRPGCASAGLACGAHGQCSDESGTAVCACSAGYTGASCEGCAAGYQDRDANGTCLADCATAALTCGAHGLCKDESGTAVCVCVPGHQGASCAECAQGFQDHDGDGNCSPDCSQLTLDCSNHGGCDDQTGTAQCACAVGYAGVRCEGCAAGYQDRNIDGTCLADCATAALACGTHGQCSDATGTAACVCTTGYQGATCAQCATGYQDHDNNGTCLADCATAALSCGAHGQCSDATGTAACVCTTGYQGATCAGCAAGYQDRDVNGTCLADCATAALACGTHAQCSDASGTAACVCAAGYQDHDNNGTCLADCATAALACGTHGQCSDATGTAACVCTTGYQGATCAQCAAGYQDHDNNGTCLADCTTAALSCGAHGQCSDTGGTAVCACATGYQGATCAQCAAGYTSDGAGGCVPATANGYTCATAIPLPLVSGTVTGSTTGAGDEHNPSCLTSTTNDSADLVYVLTPAANVHVTLETSASFDTVLSLATSCSAPELICNDDIVNMVDTNSRIEYDLVAGTTYYVFVDGYKATGSFTLTITVPVTCPAGQIPNSQGICVDDPCNPDPCLAAAHTKCVAQLPTYVCQCLPGYITNPSGTGCIVDTNPVGEGCADAIALPGQGTATGTVSGTLVGAANDANSSCGGSGGKDRVYTFTVQSRAHYELTLEGFDSVLHLRSSCAVASSELACNDDYLQMGGPSQLAGVVQPGTYYVFADGYDSTVTGPYTLSYTLVADPCAANPCSGVKQCVTSDDFLSFECVCPAGTVASGTGCVDDPCDPNPCTAANKTKCTVQLPSYQCGCNPGFVDDGAGGCMADPNGNRWTFMVYMNGDNNLAPDALDDIAEMQAAGSNTYVNIIVLHDGDKSGDTRMLRITPGGSTVLQNKGELDMGNWQTLRDFGVWVVQNYPAQHYALVMWDHGDGWRSSTPRPRGTLKAFSNDDHGTVDGISLSNGDYARALAPISQAAGRKLDVVSFDACLMGMYEVAKASAPYADYLVASEETEPGAGWSYDAFLPQLVNNYTMTPEALGRLIVDAFYNASTDDSTLSLNNLGTLPALDAALTTFADALRADTAQYSRLATVRSATQTFDDDTHRDLRDFASRVAVMTGASAAMTSSANALVTQLQTTTVYSKAQSTYPKAYGLAIYLPGRNDPYDSAYNGAGATWSTATTWDDFLKTFAQ